MKKKYFGLDFGGHYTLTIWNDLNSAYNKTLVISIGSGPVYSNTINGVHAVKFDSSSVTNHLSITNASFLNNTDYTIFVLEKRESNQASNYFLGDTTITTSNQNLILGYLADGTIIHSQAGTTAATNTNTYSSSVSNYISKENPKIFSFIQDSTSGKKTYINGILAAQSTNTSQLSNISSIKIGKGYQGQIGEIVIFNRALSNSERQDIEAYMGKKWNIDSVKSNISSSQSGSNCIGGVITAGGCNSVTCSITGFTGLNNQSNLPYASSPIAIPNSPITACASGYIGSPTYTCTATGPATIVTNCTTATCTLSGVMGVNNTTVSPGSGTLSCNASGWTGSINYTCSGGVFTEAPRSASSGCSNNYTVCRNSSGTAWVSAASGGGIYNTYAICASLGYGNVNGYGGTCGTVCGYCAGGGYSCGGSYGNGYECYENPSGAPASPYNYGSTVQWRCS